MRREETRCRGGDVDETRRREAARKAVRWIHREHFVIKQDRVREALIHRLVLRPKRLVIKRQSRRRRDHDGMLKELTKRGRQKQQETRTKLLTDHEPSYGTQLRVKMAVTPGAMINNDFTR